MDVVVAAFNVVVTSACYLTVSYFYITCSTHVKLVSTVALRLTGSRIKLLRVDGRTILNLCFRVVYFKLFELSLTSVYPLDTTTDMT